MTSLPSRTRELVLAQEWLECIRKASRNSDLSVFLDCFEPDGWLRDILIFSSTLNARKGRNAIASYLQPTFGQQRLLNVTLDTSTHALPHSSMFGPSIPVVELAFDFETSTGWGKGHARLTFPQDGEHAKALCVMFMLRDWKGHEEVECESGVFDGHNLSWGEVRRDRQVVTERSPQAVIIGAGAAGLQLAARFRQSGIKAIVIEHSARVGDVWRDRYPTLALHTPKEHHTFLYQAFPSNWPKYTPRDKVADWMEQYASTQDLTIWTSSHIDSRPIYDSTRKHWTLIVRKNSAIRVLHPQHLVFAVSAIGDPNIPHFPGEDDFHGSIQHTSSFQGGELYKGKKVLVVGAGNSSVDVCQDLVYRGAESVTLLQRSSTAVVSDKFLAATFGAVFAPGKPTYFSDLSFAGMPLGALREMGRLNQPLVEEFDRKLLDGLRKGGFKVTAGPDNSGQLLMVFDRGGGYFIDVGCGALIRDGKVKVKQGCEISQLTQTGAVFTDGTSIEVDAIILATGWGSSRDKLRRLLGDDMIDRTVMLGGEDEHGEIKMGYKSSGHPRLWFAAGDFAISRLYSKFLALQIKGIELGLIDDSQEMARALASSHL